METTSLKLHENNHDIAQASKPVISAQPRRRSTVNDIIHIAVKQCEQFIDESNTEITEYHMNLLQFNSQNLYLLKLQETLVKQRADMFANFNNGLDQIIRLLEQVSNRNALIIIYVNQIMAMLEYIKLLFNRNLHLITSFDIQNTQKVQSHPRKGTIASLLIMKPADFLFEYDIVLEQNRQKEINCLKNDMKTIDAKIEFLEKSNFIFLTLEKKNSTATIVLRKASKSIFGQFNFVDCLCCIHQYL